jgi:DNA-binding FrmR family transcriptional regulator
MSSDHATAGAASCPCLRPGDGVHAVALAPETKQALLTRLRRIEGQVRGLQKMVEEERYCADVLVQVGSVQEALRSAGRALLDNHLRHCATTAIRSGDRERAEAMYQELLDLVYRTAR